MWRRDIAPPRQPSSQAAVNPKLLESMRTGPECADPIFTGVYGTVIVKLSIREQFCIAISTRGK